MYKCLECGEIFELEDAKNIGDGWNEKREMVCPHCSGAFDEAHLCKSCGEYFTDYEMKDEYCFKCYVENKRR